LKTIQLVMIIRKTDIESIAVVYVLAAKDCHPLKGSPAFSLFEALTSN